ncbi:hypothetical protein AVEN_80295-1 [Araneus ventricosus]|uniref:Uncharacterized protein n=1 Tax=Araneus ventricosus TaxID=182803 RepID=A0A4Y2IIS5_ARAVE|nr:hypothetical protein AVEN_80295-1 [Araneus ventricosus]
MEFKGEVIQRQCVSRSWGVSCNKVINNSDDVELQMEFRGRRQSVNRLGIQPSQEVGDCFLPKSPYNSDDLELRMELRSRRPASAVSRVRGALFTKSPINNVIWGCGWNSRGRRPASAVSGSWELAVTKSPNNSDDLELQMEFKRSSTSVSRLRELGVADGNSRESSTSVSNLREIGDCFIYKVIINSDNLEICRYKFKGRRPASAVSGSWELAQYKSPINSDNLELQDGIQEVVDQRPAISELEELAMLSKSSNAVAMM